MVIDNENLIGLGMILEKKRLRYGELKITGRCLISPIIRLSPLLDGLRSVKALNKFTLTDQALSTSILEGVNRLGIQ